jgi:hypothetical protein
VVGTLRDLLGAIGQLRRNLHAKAVGQAFDTGFPVQIEAFGGAVQDEIHLFKRQILRPQRLDEAHRVLGRAHVQFQHGEEHIRSVKDRFGPLHDRGRHVDDDDVEAFRGEVQYRLHILGADHVQRNDLRRRGEHRHLAVVIHQRLLERVHVHALAVRQHFEDHLAARQIKECGGRAELKIQVDQADRRGFLLVDIGQFPRKIDRQRGGPGAAGKALHREDGRAALQTRGRIDGRSALRRGGQPYHGLRFADSLDRVVQGPFGQGIGHEIIRPQLQKLVQALRAEIVGDQDDLDVFFLRAANDLADQADIALVALIHGDGHEFQLAGFGLVKKGAGLLQVQIAPGLTQFGFHVIDQQIEFLNIPGDRGSHDRCGV